MSQGVTRISLIPAIRGGLRGVEGHSNEKDVPST
jgi:hypothetical protein